jgi:hypothetical protein
MINHRQFAIKNFQRSSLYVCDFFFSSIVKIINEGPSWHIGYISKLLCTDWYLIGLYYSISAATAGGTIALIVIFVLLVLIALVLGMWYLWKRNKRKTGRYNVCRRLFFCLTFPNHLTFLYFELNWE